MIARVRVDWSLTTACSDLSVRKDIIIDKILLEILYLQSLSRIPLFHTLSNALEINNSIVLGVYLFPSASHTVKNRSENISSGSRCSKRRQLVAQEAVPIHVLKDTLLFISKNSLQKILRNLMGDECTLPFLETGHKINIFHSFRKEFAFKKQLNYFAQIGDSFSFYI